MEESEAEKIFGNEPNLDAVMQGDKLVFDDILKSQHTGDYVVAEPKEMEIILDYTTLRGGGSNIYYSLIYQAPKWDFTVKKVDEWIQVTPTWAEYYNITTAQKQKLEQAIKSGLASAMQSVADYELLKHDSRRYKEILDYFKEAKNDEHILRSIFVDRVDVHTGEAYSLVTMARRWPTIITDFIRMKEEWKDRDQIRKELDVSMAEATILKTKNDLFIEWKNMFLPVVKERYARIEAMVQARKRSIDEYKKWLKPYIATYRMIKEKSELNPQEDIHNAFFTPGFGQSHAYTGVRLMLYKSYVPQEKGKAEAIVHHSSKKSKGKKGEWVVYPYDDFVKQWKKKIEEHYNVKITDEDVENIIESNKYNSPGHSKSGKPLDPTRLYHMIFNINVVLGLTKTPPPEGTEMDNMMFQPIKVYVVSQNVLLVLLIEFYAREKAFENYVNQMIGSSEVEKDIYKEIEEEMNEKEEEKTRFKSAKEKIENAGKKTKSGLSKFAYLFIKKGPYEHEIKERMSKMHNPVVGNDYKRIRDFLLKKMTVD